MDRRYFVVALIAVFVSAMTAAVQAQDDLSLEQKQAKVPDVGQLAQGAVPGTVLKYDQKQFAGPRSAEMHMWQVYQGQQQNQSVMKIVLATRDVEAGLTPPEPGPGKQVRVQQAPRPLKMQVSHFQAPPNVMVSSHELTITPDQEVTAGGKTYNATLYHRKVVMSQSLQEITVNHRVWISDAVPVTGIVREVQEVITPQGKQGHTLELLDFKVPREPDGPAYFIELGQESMADRSTREQAIYNTHLVDAMLAMDDYDAALQLWRNTEKGVYRNIVGSAIHRWAEWHDDQQIVEQVEGKDSIIKHGRHTPMTGYINKHTLVVAAMSLDELDAVISTLEDPKHRASLWSTVARARYDHLGLDAFKEALARVTAGNSRHNTVDILTSDLQRKNDWQAFDAVVAAVPPSDMGLNTLDRWADRAGALKEKKQAVVVADELIVRLKALAADKELSDKNLAYAAIKILEPLVKISWRYRLDNNAQLRAGLGGYELITATQDDDTVKSYNLSSAARGEGMKASPEGVDHYVKALAEKRYSAYGIAFAYVELYQTGKPDEAIKRIEDFPTGKDIYPFTPTVGKAMAYTKLALAEEDRGNTEKANAFIAKAEALITEGQKAIAESNASGGAKLTWWPGMTDEARPKYMIANLHADRGDYDKAIAFLSPLPTLDKASNTLQDVWRKLAIRAAIEGNVDAFRAVLDAMTTERLGRSSYRQSAAEVGVQALSHFGKTDEALTFARDYDPDLKLRCLAALSRELAINGDVTKAQAVRDELASIGTDYARYYLPICNAALSYAHAQAGDLDKAKALFLDRFDDHSLPPDTGSDFFAGWDSADAMVLIGNHIARRQKQPAELAKWVEQIKNPREKAYIAAGIATGLQDLPLTLEDVGGTSSRVSLYRF